LRYVAVRVQRIGEGSRLSWNGGVVDIEVYNDVWVVRTPQLDELFPRGSAVAEISQPKEDISFL